MTVKPNIYTALAAAQAEMGPALKDAVNPAFKSKYADLASVMAACLPALNRHGIAVLQPPFDDESGRYVKTILVFGETGETLEWRVPLIIQKNDMQGYGSAVTYARRYGLMCVGIAPEDDDGNAAAAAAPKPISAASMKRALSDLDNDLSDAFTEVTLNALWRSWHSRMEKEGWPAAQSADDETSYRNQVVWKFRDRKAEILERAVDEPEPSNLIAAGE
jgi:hypothetical protein